MVSALAFGTIGVVIVFAVVHIREDAPAGSYHDRPLKQRLDDPHASAHPHDRTLDSRSQAPKL